MKARKIGSLAAVWLAMSLLTGCASNPGLNSSANPSAVSSIQSNAPQACPPDVSQCDSQTKTNELALENERIDTYNQITASFTPMSFDEAIGLFQNQGTGLIYFGFSRCPWCQEVVPLLKEAADQNGVEVFYVKTRDAMKERLYTDEQRDQIAPYIGEYLQDNDEGIPTLYVPLVLAVVDGQVIDGHQGTVEDHDAHERTMTADEAKQVGQTMDQLASDLKSAWAPAK